MIRLYPMTDELADALLRLVETEMRFLAGFGTPEGDSERMLREIATIFRSRRSHEGSDDGDVGEATDSDGHRADGDGDAPE